MKTLWEIMSWVCQKERFAEIGQYADFCRCFLAFIDTELQAEIVPKNETNYRFFQYRRDGEYNITRPVNANLFLRFQDYDRNAQSFFYALRHAREMRGNAPERQLLNRFLYTTQQAIGCALDALPASKTNASRKINGDLFERLMLLTMAEMGVESRSCIRTVKIPESGEFMSFQHDIEILKGNQIAAVGSVKTSSKDRIDKVFLDKLMYNRLTGTETPHFAIFLHDAQRAGQEPHFKIGQTFLTGHFKAYTIGLSPLDGVYYCDLRPVMRSDPLLKRHIRSLYCLLCEDIWRLTEQ